MQILKFSASWCAPCRTLSTMLSTTEHDHNITEIDIDSDDGIELAAAHRVRSVPTMIMLDADQREVKRSGSFASATDLKKWMES